MMTKWLILLSCTLLIAAGAEASDRAREQRIAEQIEESILIGSPLRLQAGDAPFFAIHTEAVGSRRHGGVVLLHGRGANPDWMEVIQPLRIGLPELGWETLSIQLPVAAADAADGAYRALIPEALPRIQAAVDYLREREMRTLVLVGHSLGARMGLEYLAAGGPSTTIDGLVAIGLSADHRRRETGTLLALSKVRQPLLDIFGSRDNQAVQASSSARAAAALRAENSRYRQVEVPGADHFFSGMDDDLLARVNGWMRLLAAPEQPAPE